MRTNTAFTLLCFFAQYATAGTYTEVTDQFPQTITEWKDELYSIYSRNEVLITSEYREAHSSIGFIVRIQSPGVLINQWLGIGINYKREFPMSVAISDYKVLKKFGFELNDLQSCKEQICDHTFKERCDDTGCIKASFSYNRETIKLAKWEFPHD